MRTVTRGRTLATLALRRRSSRPAAAARAPRQRRQPRRRARPQRRVPAASAPAASAPAGSAAAGGLIAPLEDAVNVRFGVFPNITHAPGLVALADNGPLKQLLPNATITVTPFSSGTPAVEALLTDSIDITYIGPNPAINAFAKTNGEAVRVISGSTSGGAFLVVKPEITTRGRPQGQEDREPVARQHAGRRAPRVAEGAGPDDRHRRRRRRLDRAPGERADPRDVPGRHDRRRMGARAVGDPADPGWRRQGPRRRARPVAGRQVRHHPPAGGHQVPRRATPRSSSGSSPPTSRPSTRSTRTPPTAAGHGQCGDREVHDQEAEPRAPVGRLEQPHLHRRPDRVLAPEVGHRRRGAWACSRTRATSRSCTTCRCSTSSSQSSGQPPVKGL